jgi:hypothetical protein
MPRSSLLCAVAQSVSRRYFKGIFGGRSDTGTGFFLLVLELCPVSGSIPPVFRTHSLVCNIMTWAYKKTPPSPTDKVLRKMNIKFGQGFKNNRFMLLRKILFRNK